MPGCAGAVAPSRSLFRLRLIDCDTSGAVPPACAHPRSEIALAAESPNHTLHVDADPGVAGMVGRPAWLLLHGFTQDHTAWEGVRPALRALGPTLAADLPGHGASPDALASSMDACVAALTEVILQHDARHVVPVGYSMGGRTALHLALHLREAVPVRLAGLVLCGATAGLADEAARAERVAADEVLARRLEAEGLEAFIDYWLGQPMMATLQRRLSPERFAAVRARRLQGRAAGLAAALRGMGTGAMPPVWERLGEIDVPALVLVGADDERFLPLAEPLAAGMPNATLQVIPDAGHSVPAEQPDAMATAITAWWQGLTGERPGGVS